MPAFHPSRLLLAFERSTTTGALLVSSPHLPGWKVSARGPVALADALDRAWREQAVRAYADRHGEPYDLEALADVEVPYRHRTRTWTPLDDGTDRWRAPGGQVWRGDSATVQRMKAKRQQQEARSA